MAEENEQEVHEIELTEEEYDKLMVDMEEFENNFLRNLANSDKFEIIPTQDERGRFFTKEQLTLIKKECLRLGAKILYKVDLNGSVYILINPETMKIGYVSEGIH